MRTFAAFTVAGVAGLLVLKVLAVLVGPLVALGLGLMALIVKLAVVAAALMFAIYLFRKMRPQPI